MSQENVEVVRDQFAAVNERDFPRAMGHYAEDVELVVDTYSFLEGGTFKGRHAVGEWFADWFSTFEPDYRFDIKETRGGGDLVYLRANPSRERANQRSRSPRRNGLPVHGPWRQDRSRRAVHHSRRRPRCLGAAGLDFRAS